jgi:hypothetical protein
MASKRDKRGKPKPVLVKRQKRNNLNEADLWMLPIIDGIKPYKYYHTVACGELYSLYGRVCDEWYPELSFGDLISDCTMVYKGVNVHFEVDRGTESMKELYTKIDRYINQHPRDDKTIFVLIDGVRSARTTGNNLHSYLVEVRRGRQFSWTKLEMLKSDPFGAWLFNSLLEKLTLDDLCAT